MFRDPRTVLTEHGLKPKRSFGQNFLVSDSVVDKIAALIAPDSDCSVIEIGAGLGTLTRAILARGARVAAIERDRDLLPVLEQELAEYLPTKQLTLVEDDAATVDFEPLFGVATAATCSRILAGNLPYQITGKLLTRAVETRGLKRAVFMVQREVADRLIAPANGEAYGQLSVFVQAQFAVTRAMIVKSGCFYPRPEIDSAVVTLTPLTVPRAIESETFRNVVHKAFGQRRKTLRNALGDLLSETQQKSPTLAGIDLSRRGETLTVEEFAQLTDVLTPAKPS